jgi:hypothetical protein
VAVQQQSQQLDNEQGLKSLKLACYYYSEKSLYGFKESNALNVKSFLHIYFPKTSNIQALSVCGQMNNMLVGYDNHLEF